MRHCVQELNPSLAEPAYEAKPTGPVSIPMNIEVQSLSTKAVVGMVEPAGGGSPKSKEQPHAIGHAASTSVPSAHAPRNLVPIASDAERPLPDARGPVARGTEGK